jgi:hypothetical protein
MKRRGVASREMVAYAGAAPGVCKTPETAAIPDAVGT